MVRCRRVYGLVLWGMYLSLTAAHATAQLPWGDVYEHTTGTRGTRLWVPDDTPTIKGILIYGNGAGADFRELAYAPWLQQFAVLHDFALIATSMWGNLSGSEINTWDAHLAALATASAHPELVHAPWAPMGFSNGGSMAYGFNALRPEKTIAFVANKGCCYNNRTPPVAALKTPGILVSGELDTAFRHDSIKGLFDANRPRGALWSWTEQERMAHEGFVDELILPFLAEAIRLRYPKGQAPTATSGVALQALNESDGWLVDQSTWKSGLTKIAAYDSYPGVKQQAGWVLNENVAAVYRAFSTYDSPVHLEFDLDFEWPWGVFVGFETPSTMALNLDLTQLADWSKIELLNYATPVLTLTPDGTSGNVLTIQAPIPRRGVYGFSALVTHANGVTKSTSMFLAFTATPEPSGAVLAATAALVMRFKRRPGMKLKPMLTRLLVGYRVVVCMFMFAAAAQGADVNEFMDFSLRTKQGQLTMPARLYVPPAAIADPVTKRPLIVWLHGGGDAGTNNINQIRWDVDFLFAEAKRRGAFLLAPQAPLNWRPKSVTDNVVSLLNLATNQFNVDPDRLYLTGYSSGGGGTWNMLSRYPDRFAAAMPVAPVSAEPDFNPANLVGQAISVFHARNDTVVPVQTTRNVINSIMSAAGHVLPAYPSPTDDHFGFASPELDFWYFEPRNGDHSFHFNVYGSNPIIYDWLFSHTLAAPEPATLAVASLAMISIVGLTRRRRYSSAAA